MASLITVRLDKGSSPNLGFRLQGGKDFGTPLVVQKVNGGSPAERAGLLAGDSVIKINTTDVFNLRHKDAQDVIVRAGPSFEVTVQRGGSTWKPAVIPTGPAVPTAASVTKTSLAANKKEASNIGSGHNLAAKPFSPQVNGAVNGGPKLVNNQYNSPLKLYSEESIAETLSAQTEVLSTGALGVNFKKNEKSYDHTNSAVYRMLLEAEKEPRSPEPEPEVTSQTVVPSAITGLRHVTAPENRPPSEKPQLPPGQNVCADCERLIVGVFVRIKDKNLHVECFKCSTCGSSLKNVGYYNINNKLYCDVHAKLAARTNPPAPNLVPVAVPPGSRAPVSAISSALASHSLPSLPSPSPLSPKTNLAQPYQAGNYSTAPKPFSSVTAPLPQSPYNTLPRAAPAPAPLSPVVPAPAPTFSPASPAEKHSVENFVWPPPPEEPEVPTACPLYVAPESHLRVILKPKQEDESTVSDDLELEEIDIMSFQPKLSVCSQEVSEITGRRSAAECVETIAETLETQQLIERVMKNRPKSPPPLNVDIIPAEVTCCLKESCEKVESCKLENLTSTFESQESSELKRLSEFKPNTIECKLKSQVENVVPQKWESQMVQALRTIPDPLPTFGDPFTQIPAKFSSTSLASGLTIAPSVPFSAQPYSTLEPVPLPEETVPYFPPEHPILIEPKPPKPEQPESPFIKALQTAPERPFTPVGGAPVKKKKNPSDELFQDLPKPQGRLTMRDALTTASDRSYSPLVFENIKTEEKVVKEKCEERKNLQKPLKPTTLPASFQKPVQDKLPVPKPFPVTIHEKKEEKQLDVTTSSSKTIEKHKTESTLEKSVNVEDQAHGMYPLFTGFNCSFENKSEHSQFKVEISTTPPVIYDRSQTPSVKISRSGASTESVTETITEESKRLEKLSEETKKIEKQSEQVVLKKPAPVSLALHKPDKLPQYQINLSENAEAELLMMEKAQVAKARQQQKVVACEAPQRVPPQVVVAPPPPPRVIASAPPPSRFVAAPPLPPRVIAPPLPQAQTKPIIMIHPGENNLSPEQSFKPVSEERPPSSTFSPRPRPITPSMINKPPATLPYYQANLVAQEYGALEVNLLAPGSPATSRSPSPCPERRSPSPFSRKEVTRPKSPAAGPPPNPLGANKSVPTQRDFQVEAAKKNLTSYIPQYQDQMSLLEKRQPPQVYSANVRTQAAGLQAQSQFGLQVQGQQVQSLQSSGFQVQSQQNLQSKSSLREERRIEDATRAQVSAQQTGNATISTSVLEKSHLDHLEQLKKSESQSVESHGLVQIQRKKTVTEEFEHTQKSKLLQIEKNVSTSQHPFRSVKNVEEQAIQGLHVTNPQPIVSPFLKAGASQPQAQPLPPKHQAQPLPPSSIPTAQFPACSIPCPAVQPLPPCSQSCPAAATRCPKLQQVPPQPSGVKHVPAPSLSNPIKHVSAPSGSKKPDQKVNRSNIPVPNAGAGSGSGGRQAGAIGVAPKRGRGVLNAAALTGSRVPLCGSCHSQIRGPFITALGKIWCPDHFICATPSCRRPLQDLGFVEEQGQLYCEYCFEQYLAPNCSKCNVKVKGDCLKAIGKNFHPECFVCFYCGKLFGNSPFFLEDGNPYCENDWNELFTTKCYACGFPVEAGDRWVEALNNNYHSQCFNCTMCKKNLEGQSFFAKGGRPFCKNHAR